MSEATSDGRVLRAVPNWALLGGLVTVSALLRFWAGMRIPGLWIMPDEAVYASLGQSLWRSLQLSIFGGATGLYSLVYPLLAGLPLAYGDLDRGYAILKALQAVVMSLTAVPVFLWGRRLMAPRLAFGAAALTLLLPGLLYSGLVMTEVAFLPVVVLAAWAMARALEEPTRRRQALLVGAIALAAATRLQALVLFPVLLTALGLDALFRRSLETVRRFVPTLAGLGALALLWAVYRLHDGGPWQKLLGSYEAATDAAWDPVRVVEYVAYHVGDTLLLVGAVPLCALALLAAGALRGRERSPAVRAHVAVAVALVAWFVVQVGVFASAHVERFAERDLLALAPVLFLSLGVWLDRGAPRPRALTIGIAAVALLVVSAVPWKRFSQAEALPDAFSIAPLFKLVERWPDVDPAPLVVGIAALLLAGFVLLPRRLVLVLPVAIAALLLAGSVFASREVAERAAYDDDYLLGGDRSWIEEATDQPVAVLYTGELYWNGIYQQLFWNRNVERVYYLYPAAVPGPAPQEPVQILGDGTLVRSGGRFVSERYIAAPATTHLVGTPVARLDQHGIDQAGMVLWKLDGEARLSFVVSGVRPDGDLHEPGKLLANECNGGYFAITLIAKSTRRVELLLNGQPYKTVRFGSDAETYSEEIPARRAPGLRTCTLEIRPDGLLGSTRLDFLRP